LAGAGEPPRPGATGGAGEPEEPAPLVRTKLEDSRLMAISRVARIALASAGGLAVAAVLAACSSSPAASGNHRPASASTSSTTTSTTTTTVASTGTSGSSSTTTSTSAVSTCAKSTLSLVQDRTEGAAGTIYLGFSIVNRGSSPCTLSGYPTIGLVGTSGPLTTEISHSGQGTIFSVAPTTVVLPAGTSPGAGFVVAYGDVPQGGQSTCPTVTKVEVTLPGVTGSFRVAKRFVPCGAPNLSVSAVVPEATYQAQFAG
jgi:hypothetical protein